MPRDQAAEVILSSDGIALTIEMLPAGRGDCLIIRYGSRSMIVDGGPYTCFPALRRHAEELEWPLELLVVTHVDGDHVEGIVKLLQDPPSGFQVRDVWFNGWRQMEERAETLGPLAGEYLSALIQKRGLLWNKAFSGHAVVTSSQNLPVAELPGGLKATVLSPTPSGLRRMREVWGKAVAEAGLMPGNAEQALEHMSSSRRFGKREVLGGVDLAALAREAEATDNAPPNGSSIAMLIEYQNRRLLLAGDAHPTVLEQSIRRLLATRRQRRLKLDGFKISHHGSKGNTTNALLSLLECRNYLISTDGSYFGHPDDETIARIIRNGGPKPVLHFNHRQKEERFWDDRALQQREEFKVLYPGQDVQAGLRIKL